MGFEFPRPTYPGDFVSCNMYRSPLGLFTNVLEPPPGGTFETVPLVLPHDGIVADQLYEIVFGPFGYFVSADAELSINIYIELPDFGNFLIFEQTFVFSGTFTFVPALSAYFDPNYIINFLADLDIALTAIDFGSLQVQFSMAGGDGALAVIQYGQAISGTVFGLRPVDETNSDTFRVITTINDDYAS